MITPEMTVVNLVVKCIFKIFVYHATKFAFLAVMSYCTKTSVSPRSKIFHQYRHYYYLLLVFNDCNHISFELTITVNVDFFKWQSTS